MATGILIRGVEPPSVMKPDTYQVLVDGELAGSVGYSTVLELPLEPGVHTLSLKGPFFTRSESRQFFLRPGQRLEFECGTDYLGWYSKEGALAVQLLGTDAIWLRPSGVSV